MPSRLVCLNWFGYLLHRSRLADSELGLLQKAFEEAENPEPPVRGLIGERANFVTGLNSPHEIPIPLNDWQTAQMIRDMQRTADSPVARVTGFLRRDLRFYIDAMTTNIALARRPFPQKFLVASNSQAMEKAASRRLNVFSGMMLSTIDKYILREAEHLARMRVGRAAAAIERYRLRNNGGLPHSLTDLPPQLLSAIPIDPFDGKPLRYKHSSSNFLVYSIGPDQTDDGGSDAPSDKSRDKKPLDIIFNVDFSEPRAE